MSHNITLLLNYLKHHLFRGNLVFLKKHSIAWLGCFRLSGWTKCSLNKLLLSFTELRKMNAPMGRSPYLRSRSKEADTIGCRCVTLRPIRTKVINCVHLQGEVRVPILSIQIHTLNMFFPMLWLLLMKPPLLDGADAWFNLPQLLKDFLYTKPYIVMLCKKLYKCKLIKKLWIVIDTYLITLINSNHFMFSVATV